MWNGDGLTSQVNLTAHADFLPIFWNIQIEFLPIDCSQGDDDAPSKFMFDIVQLLIDLVILSYCQSR